ncbi:MAG: hypothetical protein AB1716_05555 [Planctomycetota bacterium]
MTADALEQPEVRAARRARQLLQVVQFVLLVAAVFLCFRGRGRHRDWVVLAAAVPLIRALCSAAYRQEWAAWLRTRWAALHTFHAGAGRCPWPAILSLVTVPFAVLALGPPLGGGGDTAPVVPTTVSLVRHGEFRLDTYYRELRVPAPATADGELPYYLCRRPGGVYSAYPVGMVAFALPFVAVSDVLGTDWRNPFVPLRLERWISAWVAGLAVGLFYLLVAAWLPPAPALVLTALYGLGSAQFSTAALDLSQCGGVMFWILVVLASEAHAARLPPAALVLLQGLACGLMPSCRFTAGVFVLCFGAWLLVRAPRRALLTALVAIVAALPWLAFYYRVYGHPLGPVSAQLDPNVWAGFGQHWLGVLASPGRGLLVYSPWLLLALLAPLAARRTHADRAARGWAWFLVPVAAVHFLVVASWGMWWGGHSYGPRLLAESLPLLAVLCAGPVAWLWPRRAGRILLVGCVLLAAALNVPPMYAHALDWNSGPPDVDQRPERLWSWSHPPFLWHGHSPP